MTRTAHVLHVDTGDPEGRSFREVIDDQWVYALDAAAPAGKRVAPVSGSAVVDLNDRSRIGSALADAALLIRNVSDNRSHLRGIALTRNQRGFSATVTLVAVGSLGDLANSDDDAQAVFDSFDANADRIGAIYHPLAQWIVLGPKASRELVDLLDRPRGDAVDNLDELWALYVLRHELEHSVTPEGLLTAIVGQHSWMEEGIASVLAAWPGAVVETGDAMGIPIDDAALDERPYDTADPKADAYRGLVATVRGVLDLTGLDQTATVEFHSTSPRGDRDARDLLQEASMNAVPDALAKAVSIRHALPHPLCHNLAAQVTALDGDPRNVRSLQRAVARAQRGERSEWE
jgi:hypothetical protein